MNNAIICFTRVPRPGLTKTRLMPKLSGEQCAALHTAMLQDIAEVYGTVNAALFITYAPDDDIQPLRDIFPDAKDFFPQQSSGLGERMYNAIEHVLSFGYDKVILTGADLPRLTAEHIIGGFAALDNSHIAIGPTSDGGYYLIGMKQAHFAPFDVQGYGGSSAYENTVKAIADAGLTYALAPSCDDVDTPEDLRLFAAESHPNSRTMQYIHQLGKEGIIL